MMNIARKHIDRFKKYRDERKFDKKLHEMDRRWYYLGGRCWGGFPPSFYYTHTEEEIKRIGDEAVRKLYELIDQWEPK